ncbi:MAG: PEGA domain-containing protein [Polyangiaceae bacterium]
MRRSTQIAPFSRIALLVALGALGLTAFAPSARAADTVKAAAARPTAVAPTPAIQAAPAAERPVGTKTPDKKTRDSARKAYSEGEKAFAAHDFAAAYTGFAKANEVIPSAHAAYWAAKSLDQGGKTDDAIKAYDALLANPGSSKIGDDKLTDAQTRLATLKATLVGEITVSTVPSSAQLSVDGVPQTGAQPVVLKLAPGPHHLTFTAEGFEMKEVDLQVQAGTKVEQTVAMAHIAPPPPPPPAPEPVITAPPPPPPAEKHSKVPAYVTLGIATGGAIVGTIFGVQALQSKSDYDSNPNSKSADDTERNALIADMAFGIAVTLGVTGIVLLTSSDDAADAPRAATLHLPPKNTFRVVPYIGRESGGAAARLTF